MHSGVCRGSVVGAAAAAFACSHRARQRKPAAPFLPMQTAQSLGGTVSLPQAFRRPGARGPDWPRQLTQVSSVEGRAVVPLLPRVRRRHQTHRRPAGPLQWLGFGNKAYKPKRTGLVPFCYWWAAQLKPIRRTPLGAREKSNFSSQLGGRRKDFWFYSSGGKTDARQS